VWASERERGEEEREEEREKREMADPLVPYELELDRFMVGENERRIDDVARRSTYMDRSVCIHVLCVCV
jgi:hypothetical protein